VTRPILPGVDVAALRARFIAAGGAIFKHKGDDRWVIPGFKPVRVHSGRKDAPRNLIRLVRLVEAARTEYTRVVSTPVEESRTQEEVAPSRPQPRRRYLPGLQPPAPPLSVVTLSDEALHATRVEAARMYALRAEQDLRRAFREARGRWRASIRAATIVVARGREASFILYGYDLLRGDSPEERTPEAMQARLSAIVADDAKKVMIVNLDDDWTRADIDLLIEEVGKIRGRCDLLPTAEWPPDRLARLEAKLDEKTGGPHG
jgi:hypothetical protein